MGFLNRLKDDADREAAVDMLRQADLTPAQQTGLMDKIDAYDKVLAERAEIEANAPKNAVEDFFLQPAQARAEGDKVPLSEAHKAGIGLGETALSMGTGALMGAIGGWGGLFTLLTGDNDDANNVLHEAMSKAYVPRTEYGQAQILGLAEPFMELDTMADDVAYNLGGGNEGSPLVQSSIKTALMGLPEVLVLKNTRGLFSTARQARLARKDVQNIAQELDITVTQDGLGPSILRAADEAAPDTRGADMPQLKKALEEREADIRAQRDAAYENAAQHRTYMESASIEDFAVGATQKIVAKGYDLEQLPQASARLADLRNIGRDGADYFTHLQRVDLMRKRINKSMNDVDPKGSDYGALSVLKRDFGKYLDAEFDRLAKGRGGAGTGDPAGAAAWRKARDLAAYHAENFKADKSIARLVNEEGTPEAYSAWLQGANALSPDQGPTSMTVKTVQRLKEVLGDGSPEMQAVRNDYAFSIMEPLFRNPEAPDFNGFITNFNQMVRKNPSLVRELGLDVGEIEKLNRFARMQVRMSDAPSPTAIDLPGTGARVMVGHEMAQASVRVNLVRRLLSNFASIDKFTRKKILNEIAGMNNPAGPLVARGSLAAGEFALVNAMNDMENARERVKERRRKQRRANN